MSAELKDKDQSHPNHLHDVILKNDSTKKVNLNDLVSRLNIEKKKERRGNIVLSAAAVSAVAVLGVILTL